MSTQNYAINESKMSTIYGTLKMFEQMLKGLDKYEKDGNSAPFELKIIKLMNQASLEVFNEDQFASIRERLNPDKF